MMQKLQTALAQCKIVPVVVVNDLTHAAPLAHALQNGGLTVVEVTLRTPVALEVISAMRQACPEMVIGAGTILNAQNISDARNAGAEFGVSPGTSPALLQAILDSGWNFIPGCATPSEAITLAEASFKVVKLFPAEVVGGLAMLKSLASPLPHIQFMPTGGVRLDKVAEYIAQPNVAALGGTWIAPADKLAAGDFAGIETLAREAYLASQMA
jgi:2-dehydro-3-deoxyphosphogluconate aldolase/(4S)-4-hydroxy-2-oxoglutarate aldolase